MKLKLTHREAEQESEPSQKRDVKRVRIYTGGASSTWPIGAWDVDATELRDLSGLAGDKWDRVQARLRDDAEVIERDHKSARGWKPATPETIALVERRAGTLRRRIA